MNKNKDKIGTNIAPAPVPIYARIPCPVPDSKVPKMNTSVPKMNKKIRQDQKNPKRDIKMFKNGKIAERGFFGARNFQRQKVLTGASRLGYRHTLGSIFSKIF